MPSEDNPANAKSCDANNTAAKANRAAKRMQVLRRCWRNFIFISTGPIDTEQFKAIQYGALFLVFARSDRLLLSIHSIHAQGPIKLTFGLKLAA